MPNKQNNIILYTDTDGKLKVNVRFAGEKVNPTVKNLFTVQLIAVPLKRVKSSLK